MLLAALAMASLMMVLSVGPVYAYLKMTSGPTVNTFQAAPSVAPTISESFDNTTKTNVCVNVGNTGYSVYVRAKIIITWKDSAGNVLATAPKSDEYSLSLGSNWSQGSEGIYYYSLPVTSGNSTGPLIVSCTATAPAPEAGYSLSVEVVAQTIQAEGKNEDGKSAAEDAWGWTPPTTG